MKSLPIALFIFTVIMLSACSGEAQKSTAQPSTATMQVIQFHNEHRCATCLKIESLTKKTLSDYFPSIPFSLVNVEEKKNESMVEQFEAFGTSLFLYNPKTGSKKDLTDFAFMNAGDDKKFEAELKRQIEAFLKS
jgi:hypothetical protein